MTQQQDYMIQLKDMNKWYGEFHVLKKILTSTLSAARKSLSVVHQGRENQR